ncbi:hypothetical protein DFS34DRAFT_653709 [Phlyctochytrium arcticum]|nr:hypothetical protein DFS34DRAFT_653709 [Phlyctochytrium arcticum]
MASYGGAPSCPRCLQSVYLAEQIAGPGGLWHKACLACKNCKKRLDSTSLTERDKEAYCKNCYAKMFGPKGYGFGSGAGVLSTGDGSQPSTPQYSPSTSMSSFPAQSPRGSFSSRGSVTSPTSPSVSKPRFGGSETCVKCNKAVYFAEQVIGPQSTKYHKMCFRCNSCNKMLDSTTMAEREGVIYCRACHSKQFGPKGYGFAGGAAGLSTESLDSDKNIST